VTRLFLAYLRERVRLAIYGPAVALHVAAALWATATRPTPASLARPVSLAVLLLLQFRLWDDLEDRERDRAAHPDRVLVRSQAAPFRLVLNALAIGNLALFAMAGSVAAVAGLAVLDLAFWLAYWRLRPQVPESVWRFHVLLVKYPAFVGLLALTTGALTAGRLLAAALLVYACACAYEAVHDRRALLAGETR
jgi:hypothetical protein